MRLVELAEGNVVEVIRLSPKQVVLDNDPPTILGSLSQHLVDATIEHRREKYDKEFWNAGNPGTITGLGIAHGRFKRGIRVEFTYWIYRVRSVGDYRHREYDEVTGEFLRDERTFEAVVGPSQILRFWAETEMTRAVYAHEKATGSAPTTHWRSDCPARGPADVVLMDLVRHGDPVHHQSFCRVCRSW
jgi:hypothetical protein